MKKLIVVFVVMLLGFSGFAQNTGNILNQYINIKNALVNSDSKAASQAIGTFYQSVKSGENFAQKPELVKATGKLNKASGLEKQRAAFHDVSTALWKLVKSSEVNEAVYYQYCPMKKANWLSLKKDIKNPYYGSSMLTCGTVAETK